MEFHFINVNVLEVRCRGVEFAKKYTSKKSSKVLSIITWECDCYANVESAYSISNTYDGVYFCLENRHWPLTLKIDIENRHSFEDTT